MTKKEARLRVRELDATIQMFLAIYRLEWSNPLMAYGLNEKITELFRRRDEAAFELDNLMLTT